MKFTGINLGFIKARRKKLGFTLQEMAEAIGFKNASTYMKYEKGEYAFKADQLPGLANKLECDLEDFFDLVFAKSANADQTSA